MGMSVEEEWKIDLLTVVILHLELLIVCDIITLQTAIYKQFRKYGFCITIGLIKPSAYYKKLPLAYFHIDCRKEGDAYNWRNKCCLDRAQQGHLQAEVMDGGWQQTSQPGWKY